MLASLKNRDFTPELTFSASRSGGAGGQNVNKVNTKVELRFAVDASQLLSDDEKRLVHEKLAARINAAGELIIVSQTERTQLGNKMQCIDKLYDLLENALRIRKKRKPTKPTKSSMLKRLESKRHQAERKEARRNPSY